MKTTNTMKKLESTFFFKLDLKPKERYEEKMKLIENADPYMLQKEAFTENSFLEKKIFFQKSYIQILSTIFYLLQVH